jgi:hypothetical protein
MFLHPSNLHLPCDAILDTALHEARKMVPLWGLDLPKKERDIRALHLIMWGHSKEEAIQSQAGVLPHTSDLSAPWAPVSPEQWEVAVAVQVTRAKLFVTAAWADYC